MGSSLLLKGGTNTPKSIEESFSLANSFAEGDVIRYDIPSSTWVKAQADSAENSEVVGVVSSASFNTFNLIYSGYIQVSALSGVSAPVLFLDSTIAGGLTTSPPSAIGSVIKPVLTKTTNGSGYIVTNYLGTQIGGSSTVAIDEIQPVGTVVPFAGSTIPDSWLECNGNSYAVGAYPYLYSKLQYSSGDRVPAYGHVAVLTSSTTPNASYIGSFIQQGSTVTTVRAKIIATTATTYTVQTVPIYSHTTKNFVVNNTVFTPGNILIVEGSYDGSGLPITAVSITHFNTPDLRGRVALGVNTSAIPDTDDDFLSNINNSAISGIYSLGSAGGQESTVVNIGIIPGGAGSSAFVNSATTTGGLIANMPPYTVVRYIIKASPYTRAAIIDGIDIPYTSLLVGDLRDGTLRPGGIGEDLLFKTNDGSSGTERMRLTNDGNLLIGTTFNQPGHKFIVSGANGMGVEFLPGYIGNGSLIQAYDRSSPGTGYTTLRIDAEDFIFNTVGSGSFAINNSGQANIAVTIDSTSPSTGGLTLGGGLGMAKNLTVGGGISAAGGITFSGITRVTNNTPSTTTATGALTVAGGVGIAGALNVGAGGIKLSGGGFNTSTFVNITDTNASTSTGSGALIVAGGAGIVGALYVGGITTAGGISMGGALTVGGGITAARLDLGTGVMKSGSITTGSFSATTLGASGGNQSSSVSSGDLVVLGGAGIGKNLFVGGGITAAGSLDLGTGAIRTSGSLNCGNIAADGTFQAKSLNASVNTTSTSTGSGSLVVVGGAGIGGALNVGGGISAGGGITSAGNLNLGTPRNYTSTSPYGNMIRAVGFHNNTKIQLVASGEGSGTFIGNGTTAGSALLMWAGEPQLTYSGSGIGNNLNASPGSTTGETRQFTEQAQTFIRFTDNGRIGFHTSAVGAIASLTPKVAILSTGGLDVQSGIVSTSSASGALVVTGVGGVGIGGALNVGGALNAGVTASFSGNVGIGANASSDRLTIDANTSGYSGGIIHSNLQSSSYYRIIPLGTNHGVAGWENSSVVFEGVPNPGASGNTIIGSFYNDLVFQTGARANRMVISNAGNVGIGTTLPNSLLNISGGSPVLNLENTTSTAGTGSVLRFGHNQSSDRRPVAEIKTVLTSGSASRAGHLTISTSTSGTLSERMRITDTGYVGIGTTSINAKLEIVGAAGEAEALRLTVGTNSNVGVRLYEDGDHPTFLRFRPISSAQNGFIFSDNADSTLLTVQAATGRVGIGTNAPGSPLHVVGPQNYGSSANSGIVTIGNANNSRQINLGVSDTNSVVYIEGWVPGQGVSHLVLQPTSGGRVGIGKSVPTQALDVVGSIVASGAVSTSTLNVSGLSTLTRLSVVDGTTDLYGNSYTIAGRAGTLGPTNNGGVIGTTNNQQIYGILGLDNTYAVYAHGPILSNANITAFSDIRSKENISTIENGLSKTLTLNGVLYTDKETQQRRTGLIAQDVLAVLPEAVHTTADGYYSLAYGNLVGLLVQAIKELNAKVDSLSAKVETLSSGASE